MQKILTLSLLISTIIVAWCSRWADTTPSLGDDTVTNDPIVIEKMDFKQTGIDICDRYLAVLRCVAMASSGDISTNYMQSHASFLQSRANMPVTQLTQTCTVIAQSLQTNVAELQKYGCKM